jgi:hypothetical protein
MDPAAALSPFPWRRELRNGFMLAFLPVLIMVAFMIGSADFTLIHDDSISYSQPLVSDAMRQLFAGRLPLWSHHTACGYPLLARHAEIIYPPYIFAHCLCLAFDLADREILLSYLVHAFAAAFFSFLYLRFLGTTMIPAAIGALGYSLAGPNLGFWTNWPNYFVVTPYIPLALLIVERLRAGPADMFWVALTGLCGGLVILINSPMVIIKFFLLVAGYFLLRASRPSFARSLGVLLGGFILAVVIGAGQVLATAQLVGMSERIADFHLGLANYFILSVRPLTFAGTVWPFLQWPWRLGFYQDQLCTAGGIFVGPLFALGLIGLFTSRRARPALLWVLLALMALYLLLSLGAHLSLNIYLYELRPLRWFRWPMRWLLEFCCLAALFTGFALEDLRRHCADRGTKIAGALFLALVVLLATCLPYHPAGFETWAVGARFLWIGFASLLSYQLMTERVQGFLWTALVFSMIALVVNVPLAQQNEFSVADLRNLRREPLYLETADHERVLYLAQRHEQQCAGGEQSYAFLMPHQFGTHSVLSYRYLLPHERWAAGTNYQGNVDDEPLAIQTFLQGHLLETLRVGYVIIPRSNAKLRAACARHPKLELERELNWVVVYRHTGFRAAAFFVAEAWDERQLGGLSELGQAPLSRVCFTADGYDGPRRFQGEGRVEAFDEQHGRISLTTDGPAEGLLVVTTTWYPGWQAHVDGQEAQILRVNGGFMAIRTPPGRHQVELVFWPTTIVWLLRVGLAAGALLFFVWLALLVKKLRWAGSAMIVPTRDDVVVPATSAEASPPAG